MSRPQHSKSTFQDSWFVNPKYNLGISSVETNKTKAHCKLCHKTFDLACGGATALDSHQKGQEHQHLKKTRKTDAIGTFFSPQPSSKSSHSGTANAVCSSNPRKVSGSLSSFVVDENTLMRE